MAGLAYRRDMDEVRQRLTLWWQGGDLGRPALHLYAPRPEPAEAVPAMPEPPGWTGHYSTRDFDYRVNLALRECLGTYYLAEAVPCVLPDLAPNCLALYLGCRGVEMPDTVWCEPCMDSPAEARFEYDPANFYWDFTLRLAREQLRLGAGKFLTGFPDLIEGLDTLAAMRGTEPLLVDLTERPDWVRWCLRQITDRYFHYYDILYDLIRDEVGGSHFWAWAPGRMAKFQCDFSAMISPDMFGEYMVPVLREMCERVAHSMFHWDGPGALGHHDHLLSIPRLSMLQWTPGAGVEPVDHPRWWPLYHKTVEAGKKVFVNAASLDSLLAMKREFGDELKQFLIAMWVASPEQAAEVMRIAEV
ncbi:MAG TPA: hypothetical protein PLD23_00405 [Armatimonadota bacterium]|nr:hypothetical protein [Armatimonadota bacterium]HQK91931.1 hypothetical protein [Armatimonadota bacterium]